MAKMRRSDETLRMAITAVCLALSLLLPRLTPTPQLATLLCLMHIPVLLCGLTCGAHYGFVCGFLAPLLSFFLFGKPFFPIFVFMMFELATYGFIGGSLRKTIGTALPSFAGIAVSLIAAMAAGRLVYGIIWWTMITMGVGDAPSLHIAAYWTAIAGGSWPGILLQLVSVPGIVFSLERAGLFSPRRERNT